MQFSVISIVAALAATATATYVPTNGTATTAPLYPTGTGAAQPTGARPTSTLPFTGGASNIGGSALGLIVAGGVALVSFFHLQIQVGPSANQISDAINVMNALLCSKHLTPSSNHL
jgi:hypothetical protein